MKTAGVRPAIIYAFEKTGVLVTESNRHMIPNDDCERFDAAFEEWHEIHGEPGRVKLRSVDTGMDIFASSFSLPRDDNAISMRDLLRRCLAVQEHFSRPLRVPADGFSDEQARGICLLSEILRSGKQELGNTAVSVPVDQELAEKIREKLADSGNLAFRPEGTATFILLGETFDLGMRTLVIIEPVLLSVEPHNDGSDQDLVLVTIGSKVGVVRLYYDNYKQQELEEDNLH